MKQTTTLIYTIIAALGIMLAMASCSNDREPAMPDPDQGPALIMFGGFHDQRREGIEWINGRTAPRSRDGEPEEETPQGTIPSVTPDDIGVFAFGFGANTTYVFRNQRVFFKQGALYGPNRQFDFRWKYPDNAWPYTTETSSSVQRPWERIKYRFFAYSPYTDTEYLEVSAETFAGFNKFRWDNVPGFTDKDYMIAHNIELMDNTEEKTGVKPFTTDTVVVFKMRHILSRVRFFFRMSPDYRLLRKIRLNRLIVNSAGKVKTATFNFSNDSWDDIVHWSNEVTGPLAPVPLYNESGLDYDIVAGDDYPDDPFASIYVYPQEDFNAINIELDYSVLDSKGVVTRTASVTNTVSIPHWVLKSGYYYDIKINIAPAYLYVLSDNDQDFDGFVILKDKTPEP